MANPRKQRLDWEDLRVFLAIAQSKSLTRAARSLDVAQPTAGRRLASLEKKVGAPLFERTAQGLVVSELGRRILDEVERMDAAAHAVERRIAGGDQRHTGPIRVTCLEWFGVDVLAPICARFSRLNPGVVIEIATDSRQYSLSKREADLALRFVRFEQLDVVQRKLGSVELRLYAAPEYLESFGQPALEDGLSGHALITLHEGAAHVPDARWLREVAFAARVAIQSPSTSAMLRAAESGAGLVLLPRHVGDGSQRLVPVTLAKVPPTRPIWLGVHEDLQHVPRIRAFIEFASASITRLELGPRKAAPRA